MEDHNPDHLPNESVADRLSAWFVCPDGDKTIRAWGSFFTGKEIIYLDEHVVSELRNMKKDSVHTFVNDGNTYKVQYHTVNQINGKLECRFYKNNFLLKASGMEFKKGISIKPRPLSGKRGLLIILYAIIFAVLYFANIALAPIAVAFFLLFTATQLVQLKMGRWEIKELES